MTAHNEMTQQQQIDRDLAEKVMGFTWGADACGRECWLDSEGLPATGDGFSPSSSRDDAHELLDKLTEVQWLVVQPLIRAGCPPGFSRTRYVLTATPEQISEALVNACRHWER